MNKRKLNYIEYANYLIQRIMEGKIAHNDNKVIDFFINLTEKESANITYLESTNADEKAFNVIRNYFAKLKKSIRNTEEKAASQA